MANSEIMKEAKSVRRWAASVAMARLLERTPPTTSAVMKSRQSTEASTSLLRALVHHITVYPIPSLLQPLT